MSVSAPCPSVSLEERRRIGEDVRMLDFLLLCACALVAPERTVATPLPTMESLQREAAAILAPYASADGTDAGAIMLELRNAMREVADELEDEENGIEIVFDLLILDAEVGRAPDPVAHERKVQSTRAALDRLAAMGVFDRVGALAVPILMPDTSLGGPQDNRRARERFIGAGSSRRVAVLLAARNAEALRRGDREAFVRGTRHLAQLARVMSVSIGQIGHLSASAIEQLMLSQVRSAVASGLLDETSLAALDPLLLEPAVLSPGFAMRGEGVVSVAFLLETVDEMMQEIADEANEGREDANAEIAPARPVDRAQLMLPSGLTLEAQVSLTRRAFAEWAVLADMAPVERAARRTAHADMWNAVIGNLLLGSMFGVNERLMEASDMMRANRVGTRTLVALERFRLARGAYPESLEELVPAFMPEAPRDPYTGHALGYLPPSRGAHAGGRGFVLYAAGSDLKDDGGVVDFTSRYNPDRTKSGGQDMPLNVERGEKVSP